MQAKLAHDGSQRTLVLVFDPGEELIGTLTRYVRKHRVTAAHFTGIGAFSEAVLGFFDGQKKEYDHIPLQEQVEVLSLAGDVAMKDGEAMLHAHVVVGKSDGTAHGGHLLSGTVRPTLELILVQSPATLTRRSDPDTGLALLRFDRRAESAARNGGGTRRRPPKSSVAAGSRRRRPRD